MGYIHVTKSVRENNLITKVKSYVGKNRRMKKHRTMDGNSIVHTILNLLEHKGQGTF